jgi:hypothetical protein
MTTTVTRLVLARSFDESLDRILGSFIGEGFTIRTVDSGNLCGHGSARRLRYAVLDIVLPDRMRPGASSARAPAVGCRVTLFEFTDGCTLLTAEHMLRPDVAGPLLDISERIARALRLLTCASSRTVGAA